MENNSSLETSNLENHDLAHNNSDQEKNNENGHDRYFKI